MSPLPSKFDLPDYLSEKVASFGESSYGVTLIALVLKDGTRIPGVHVAWARTVIKATCEEDDSALSILDPSEVVDVLRSP